MLPNQTVVGLFKNMRDADRVAADLENAGIPNRDIKVVDNRELETPERGFESDIRQRSGAGILTLLKRLFGTEHHMDFEHPSALYTDWVRNGGILIAVNTDDIHAEQVSKIMETAP